MEDSKLIVSVAITKEGKYLIVLRARDGTYPGVWEFPAGKVMEGEKLSQAVVREVREEVNLKLKKLQYVGETKRSLRGNAVIHHFAAGRGGSTIKLSKEHADYKWADKAAILGMKPGVDVGQDTLAYFTLKNRV